MLTDTHAHLEMEHFSGDLDEVIKRAADNGVSTILTVGSTLWANRSAVELAEKYESVYAAVGFHPHAAAEADPVAFDQLRKHLDHPKVVAVGEMGLDYYRDYSPRDMQHEVFRAQLRIAVEAGLPIIVHSREAHEDTMRILQEEEAAGVKGILHCFSGDMQMAEQCVGMGFLLSFAGPLTYPNAVELRETAASLHLDNILIETDCPYLAPQAKRGKRNEPGYVRYVADKLAELHGLTTDDIARVTTLNAHRMLKIGDIQTEGRLAYRIRDSLYLNLTNRCSCRCDFCIRFFTDYVKGHNLRLKDEPTVEELWRAAEEVGGGYDEVVFCGLGEPTLRLKELKELAKKFKAKGMSTRVDTNGHANLIHGRNVVPELEGIIDAVNISLNAHNAETYVRLCRPSFPDAYEAVKDFVLKAKGRIPGVSVTVVDVPGKVDVEECRRIAREELGVDFRLRKYNVYG